MSTALVPAVDAVALIARLEQARTLLAESRDLEWVKQVRDQAEAVRVYARQQELGREAEVHAAEIRVRAERRIGTLTADLPTAQGARTDQGTSTDGRYKSQVLRDAGIKQQRASEYERMAAIPEASFEAKLHAAQANIKPVTTAALLRVAVSERPPPQARPRVIEPPRVFPGACPHCGGAVGVEVRIAWESRTVRVTWTAPEHDGQDWFDE